MSRKLLTRQKAFISAFLTFLLIGTFISPLIHFPSDLPAYSFPSETTANYVKDLRGVLNGAGLSAIALGDVDGDGKTDVVAASSGDNASFFVLHQEADGSFKITNKITYNKGLMDINGIVLADLNNDGKLDIALYDEWAGLILIYFNNGNGYFSGYDEPDITMTARCPTVWPNPQSIAVGDFNNDSKNDIVVGLVCSSGASLNFYYQGFTDAACAPDFKINITTPDLSMPDTIRAARVNNDNLDDIVVANRWEDEVYVYYQDANGFSDTSNAVLKPGRLPTSVAVGDLNNDKRMDIVVTGYANETVYVYYQNATGGFSQTANTILNMPGAPHVGFTEPMIADFNSDGLNDAAATQVTWGPETQICIFYQNSENELATSANVTMTVPGWFSDIENGCINWGDNLQDIVTANSTAVLMFYQEKPTVDLTVSHVYVKGRALTVTGTTPSVLKGENVKVTGEILNQGKSKATNVVVRFFVDNIEKGNTTITQLNAGGRENISFTWSPTKKGSYIIKIRVDKKSEESNSNNNELSGFADVLTPNLRPIAIYVTTLDSHANVSALVINDDKGTAFNVKVRFYTSDPGSDPDPDNSSGLVIGESVIESIAYYDEKETPAVRWGSVVADTNLWVWVNPEKEILESNDTDNKYNFTLPSKPFINEVRPYYKGYRINAEKLMVLTNEAINIDYTATISSAKPVNQVNFTLTGPQATQHYTDSDGTDGWSWMLNFTGYTTGTYTISVVAIGQYGIVSDEVNYTVIALSFPQWLIDMGASVGPFEVSFSNGVLSYKISSEGWDFFKQSDDGANSGKDPMSKDESSTETSAEVSVTLSSDGTGKLEGKAGGEAKMIGKAPVFVKKVSFGIEASATVDFYTFKLTGGSISGNLEVELEQTYGLVVPILNWQIGIKIKGVPSLTVTYTFDTDDNGNFVNQALTVKVGCYVQGGVVLGVVDGDWENFGCGIEGYGYADPSLTGSTSTPHFKIEVAVGAGGTINTFGKKWEGKWEAFKWGWPSYGNVTRYNLTETQMPLFGSGTPTGNNLLLASDIFYDTEPYLAADYTNHVYAVWVTNKTIPDQMQVMYSIFDGHAWTQPRSITSSLHAKLDPVIAFDYINNKGLAVWVQDNANLTRANTTQEIFNSFKDMELYYSIYKNGAWSPEQQLTVNNCGDTLPRICADTQGNIMVVWEHDYDGNHSTRTDRDIFYSIWNTNTEAWNPPLGAAITIPAFPERDAQPVIAYKSTGQALVVWVHDEDSSRSSFENKPPRITESFANPNPAAQGNTVKIFAKVFDESVSAEVAANVTFPNAAIQQISMTLNQTSGYYEGSVTASQNGLYEVNITAEDPEGKESKVSIGFTVPPLGNNPPVVTNPYCNRNFVHLNDEITISAKVVDDIGISTVWAQVKLGATSSTVIMTKDTDNVTYAGEYTPTNAGFYDVLIFANDTTGLISTAAMTKAFEAVGPVDTEIYYSTYTPGPGWTAPTRITDRLDYQASDSPSVVYDSNDTGVIVWEEHFEDDNSFIYNAFLLSGGPSIDAIKPEKAVNLGYGNHEPKLARTNNGFALLSWRADVPYPEQGQGLWPEIYYAVINVTRLTSGPGGDYITPVWSYAYRVTYNSIVDWKPTVAIDPTTNKVTLAWLGHDTKIEGNPKSENFTLEQDDDDIYFDYFDFPISKPGLNEVTRLADGSKEEFLKYDNQVTDRVIYINIPEFSYPDWDASLYLTGIPTTLGEYPANVAIDLGDDGTYELIFPCLNGTKTYYLNAIDAYHSLDGYLQTHWFIEGRDGEPDGKIKVPIRIHSDTPGMIKVWGITIGYSFQSHQRPPPPPNNAPTLDVPSEITVSEKEKVLITAVGSDPDGDDLVFYINDSRFEQKREFFSWLPGDGNQGNFTVTIAVSDFFSITQKEVKITVLDDNKPPVLDYIAPITVQEGEIVNITAFASDPNNDMLGYSINDTRFRREGNLFTWQTTTGDAGTYAVLVTVTDGVYKTSQTVQVVVASHGWEHKFTVPTGNPVVDFAIFNGTLYAAANNTLYAYNGISWNAITAPTFITSLEPYEEKLIVGGQGGLYCYDGTSFSMIFSVPTYIKVLGAYNNRLYAGTMLANPPTLYYCNGSVSNPSDWHIDTGFSTILGFSGAFGSIDSFAVYDSAMYVGSGGKLYSFNGTGWNTMVNYDDVSAFLDMQVYNGKLYLATRDQAWRKPFYQGGTGFSGRVIEFDGASWTTILDHNYWVYSLGVCDGKLYAGTANKILTYNGTSWETSFNATEGAYYAICFENYNDKIYAGMGNGYIFADPPPEKNFATSEPKPITVPEFPSTTILPLLMCITLIAIILPKKKKAKA